MDARPDIRSTELLCAGDASGDRVDLSLLDVFEYPIPIDVAYVFERAVPADELVASLRETLRHYPDLRGRLRRNRNDLWVERNDAGAGFTRASTEASVGGLDEAELARLPVAPYFAANKWLRAANRDVPLLCVQHTETACGGMILGVQAAHALLDGESMIGLMRNWARVHAGEAPRLAELRRDAYDARFGAAEVATAVPARTAAFKRMSGPMLLYKTLKLVWDSRSTRSVVLSFDSARVAALRDEARSHARGMPASVALLAHLWRTFAAMRPNADADRCGLFSVTGTRQLADAEVPRDYAGNAVWHVRAESTYGELRTAPLGKLAEQVRTAHRELSYARVCTGMQWLRAQHARGKLRFGVVPNYELMRRDFFATNMVALRMYQVDFGRGRPMWVTTRRPPVRWMIRLFPRPSGDGIAAHCTVPRAWQHRLAAEPQRKLLYGDSCTSAS